MHAYMNCFEFIKNRKWKSAHLSECMRIYCAYNICNSTFLLNTVTVKIIEWKKNFEEFIYLWLQL